MSRTVGAKASLNRLLGLNVSLESTIAGREKKSAYFSSVRLRCETLPPALASQWLLSRQDPQAMAYPWDGYSHKPQASAPASSAPASRASGSAAMSAVALNLKLRGGFKKPSAEPLSAQVPSAVLQRISKAASKRQAKSEDGSGKKRSQGESSASASSTSAAAAEEETDTKRCKGPAVPASPATTAERRKAEPELRLRRPPSELRDGDPIMFRWNPPFGWQPGTLVARVQEKRRMPPVARHFERCWILRSDDATEVSHRPLEPHTACLLL